MRLLTVAAMRRVDAAAIDGGVSGLTRRPRRLEEPPAADARAA